MADAALEISGLTVNVAGAVKMVGQVRQALNGVNTKGQALMDALASVETQIDKAMSDLRGAAQSNA